jgi:hypothetical protein
MLESSDYTRVQQRVIKARKVKIYGHLLVIHVNTCEKIGRLNNHISW